MDIIQKFCKIYSEVVKNPWAHPTNINREKYLDLAEIIVRYAVECGWQDANGRIFDNSMLYRSSPGILAEHGTARFVGALGQLIKAGRCTDLLDCCIKSYERLLGKLDEYPGKYCQEFFIKEMMYTHEAIKENGLVSRFTIEKWEQKWNKHKAPECYSCYCINNRKNALVFAVTGEFFKQKMGLNYNNEMIEEYLSILLDDFNDYYMYKDHGNPITYDLVVKQQLDMIRHYGYNGIHLEKLKKICTNSALVSLMIQSTTGQMPFGGRSNQFHLMEAHFLALCETRAQAYIDEGDKLLAGMFKRAGRIAVKLIEPWIRMEPFRPLKQGFDPYRAHGVDSGGFYSVYGLLCASLLATAYHLAEGTENIEEVKTPVEVGGFVIDTGQDFHKVFATCQEYHIEVETKADHEKDSTGFGRLHRTGFRPEHVISGSITSTPSYYFNLPGLTKPSKCLAIGLSWIDPEDGSEHCLAEYEKEITHVKTNIINENCDCVEFEIVYKGNFHGCSEIFEVYKIDRTGVIYSVKTCNPRLDIMITVPLIDNDGVEKSIITIDKKSRFIAVIYRGKKFIVEYPQNASVYINKSNLYANRNAIYKCGIIKADKIKLILE